MKLGGYAIADTLRIGGLTWLNAPFAVLIPKQGMKQPISIMKNFSFPVIGLPVMLCMQEIQLDFAHREIIIPAIPTPNPLGKSNLIRTDTEGLQLKKHPMKPGIMSISILIQAVTTLICSLPGTTVTKRSGFSRCTRFTLHGRN